MPITLLLNARVGLVLLVSLAAAGCRSHGTPPDSEGRAVVASDVNSGTCSLSSLPRTRVSVTEKDGSTAEYAGVSLHELPSLRGSAGDDAHPQRRMASEYFIVTGHDEYRVVVSRAECDPRFAGGLFLLADERNGAPLSDGQGPIKLIVPGDHTPARHVRSVASVVLRTVSR